VHNCLSLLGWWIITLTILLAEHIVPHCERLSKRKSSGLSAYQLIPGQAQGCIGIATKASEFSVFVLLELCNSSVREFACYLDSQSICLTSHALLSNIQSGACNKLVIAWQHGLHARYWHCCGIKPEGHSIQPSLPCTYFSYLLYNNNLQIVQSTVFILRLPIPSLYAYVCVVLGV